MTPEEQKPDDAWIEKVVKITTALGMNPTRTRWRLIRWQESRRKAARRREQSVDHIRYQHKTCDACGSVQDREATTCSRCEAKLGGHTLQVARRIGLVPRSVSVSMVVALALMAVYVRVLIAAGGGIGSPSGWLLYDFGGHVPAAIADEPWRWLTAIFLHAGLWHLAFNLIAIAMIGPRIEELYGRGTMLVLLLATGVLANIGSGATGLEGVGIGASGGVMGLIGVAAGYGHRLGRPGHALRNDMLRWTAYTIFFGFFIGADNRAHAFGGLAGAVFGFAIAPRQWNAPRLKPLRVLLQIAAVLAGLGALAIIFTRTPSDHTETQMTASYEPYAAMCRKHFAGDAAGARAELDKITALIAADTPQHGEGLSGGGVELLCESMLALRDWCRSGAAASAAVVPGQPRMDEHCPLAERAFGSFTQQPKLRDPAAELISEPAEIDWKHRVLASSTRPTTAIGIEIAILDPSRCEGAPPGCEPMARGVRLGGDVTAELAALEKPDERVIADSTLSIVVDYPIARPVAFTATSAGGFTRRELVRVIASIYANVYRREEATRSAPPVKVTQGGNMSATDGEFGISGHTLEQLLLEGVWLDRTGGTATVWLAVGS